MYGYGMSHGFGFLGGIFSLIFWFLIVWLVFSLLANRGHFGKGSCCGQGQCGHKHEKNNDDAVEILRERFAKGELSKEEFEEKSQVLEGKKTA